MSTDQNSLWCDKCGYHVAQEWIEAQECPFWECPLDKNPVVGEAPRAPLSDTHRSSE